MTSRVGRGWLSAAVALAALASGGCGETPVTGDPSCPHDFATEFDATFDGAEVDALLESVARFNVTSLQLEQDALQACNAIAEAGGEPTASDVEGACAAAKRVLEGLSADLTVEVTPARCSVSATAAADCAARCDAEFDASATPPRCEGGTWSGTCSGQCTGRCTLEGEVACNASCSGTCSGTCTGTVEGSCSGDCIGTCEGSCSTTAADGSCMGQCDGVCRGECSGTVEGSCSGTCEGSCTGSCTAEVSGECTGRCTGECDVDFVEPRCEGGNVQVDASAECRASCEAEASLQAECTPAVVVVTIEDPARLDELADVAAAVHEQLPRLLLIAQRAAYLADLGAQMATQAEAVADRAGTLGLQAVACLLEAADVMAAAVPRVRVTVRVSVEVSGTVSGGTGGV